MLGVILSLVVLDTILLLCLAADVERLYRALKRRRIL